MPFVIKNSQANPTQTSDGELTARGMEVAHRYAVAWVEDSARLLKIEREFPELDGVFYDIRSDPSYARFHALPDAPQPLKPVIPLP